MVRPLQSSGDIGAKLAPSTTSAIYIRLASDSELEDRDDWWFVRIDVEGDRR